jgi:hypothetical protein
LLSGDVLNWAVAATEVEGATAPGPLAVAWGCVAEMAAIEGDGLHVDVDDAVARALSNVSGRDTWDAQALNLCAEAFFIVGRYTECVPLAKDGVAVAEAVGLPPLAMDSRRMLTVAWHLLDEHARALEQAERIVREPAGGFGCPEAVVLAADGQLDRAQGRVDESQELAAAWTAEGGNLPLMDVDVLITRGCMDAIAGDHERSATILAAARSLGRRHGHGFRTPSSFALYKHYLPLVRAALGPERARQARDRGRVMTLDEAIHYAHTR